MSWAAVLAAVVVGAPAPATVPAAPVAPPAATGEEPTTAQPDQSNFGEAQVLAGVAAAETARGPLDGRWRVSLVDGQPLYVFQISDSGGVPDARSIEPIEGAWRDLRRPNALDASGVFAVVRRDQEQLSIVFYEGVGEEAETLRLDAAGQAWTGELVTAGTRSKVVMTRN